MRAILSAVAGALLTILILVGAARHASADQVCVKVAAGVTTEDGGFFMPSTGECANSPFPTDTFSARPTVPGVAYVEVWASYP